MKRRFFLLLIAAFVFASFTGMAQPVEKACFSVSGGFYETSPVLELYPYYQQHHIRFTTNGNIPTAQSRLYTEPLLLDESLYSTSDIYTIRMAPDGQMFYPESVQHCIVIRAAVFDQNDSCISEVATNSYFIRSLGCDTHGLPVMSICSDSTGLFNFYHGILVPGCYQGSSHPDWTGNYFCKGREWERVCNVEFYETNNTGVNQIAGLRTHGGASRRYQQKGLKVFAREEYGKKRFKHLFFPGTTSLNSFKHLSVKPFRCSNWLTTGVQDHLAQQVASTLDIECLASRQMVLFLNGEYWGIYALEESPDERYLEDHFGVYLDDCSIIKVWNTLDYGDDTQWNNLVDWVMDADFSLEENYQRMCEMIDMDNFIDYEIFELYSSNVDWPKNNVRCWKTNDGKWRWIFYDGDGCFFRDWDVFANAVNDDTSVIGNNPSAFQATLFFRKLLENHTFRTRFKVRFNQLMSNQLSYETTSSYFNAVSDLIRGEVPNQSSRFGFPENMAQWEEDIRQVDTYLLSLNQSMNEKLNNFLSVLEHTDSILAYTCYPNPFSDQMTLSIKANESKTSELYVLNMLGQVVYHETLALNVGNNKFTLNLALAKGIYVMKIDNRTKKIIKQ